MRDILDAWMESLGSHVLISSLSDILKSSDVGLHDVADDIDKVCRLHTVHSGWDTDALDSPGVVSVGIPVPILLHPPWNWELIQELHIVCCKIFTTTQFCKSL